MSAPASTPPAVPTPAAAADPRLILREEELDAVLELLFLADASLWSAADPAIARRPKEGAPKLGRGHYRAAFLLKRRPGLGVQDMAKLTGLSKQGASRVLSDLAAAGMVVKGEGEEDGRRRPATLTEAGIAFERGVSERLRGHLARAYRAGGLDAAPGARRILAALAGARAPRGGVQATAMGEGR